MSLDESAIFKKVAEKLVREKMLNIQEKIKADYKGDLSELMEKVQAVSDKLVDELGRNEQIQALTKALLSNDFSSSSYLTWFFAIFYSPKFRPILFVLAFLTITSILVFFGYKLYMSLTEKERKREEKRRQKLQKKKK